MNNADDYCRCKNLEGEVNKLKKINEVLLGRIENSMSPEGCSYTLFQTAVTLENKVRNRTSTLEGIIESLNEKNYFLLEAKEKAELSEQEKTKFLARMSHELRTPMNSILGFSQLMLLDSTEVVSPLHTDYLYEVLKAGEHLLELIDEVLDLAKIDAGKINLSMGDVELWPVLNECVSLLGPVADRRNIKFLINDVSNMECCVRADRMRLKQVIINLLTNAIKYNKEGGSISLSCNDLKDGWIRIAVTDEGQGISRSEHKQIFEPFERLINSTDIPGTGIGLALVKQLLVLMGGSVSVDSVQGKGSTFWFVLPVGQGSATLGNGLDSGGVSIFPLIKPHYTLLYVEDNPANIKLVSEIIIRRPEIKLLTAENAGLGLDVAMACRPDLILLDIHLPDMNGTELLNQLRQHWETKDIPVVAVSADVIEPVIQKTLNEGFKQYITKPIEVEKFNDVINCCLCVSDERVRVREG
jgi:two-component system, sensor histidine kinase and response regulator